MDSEYIHTKIRIKRTLCPHEHWEYLGAVYIPEGVEVISTQRDTSKLTQAVEEGLIEIL